MGRFVRTKRGARDSMIELLVINNDIEPDSLLVRASAGEPRVSVGF